MFGIELFLKQNANTKQPNAYGSSMKNKSSTSKVQSTNVSANVMDMHWHEHVNEYESHFDILSFQASDNCQHFWFPLDQYIDSMKVLISGLQQERIATDCRQ